MGRIDFKELFMTKHTILFCGDSGRFEDLYPDLLNKKIISPAEEIKINLPDDYEYRRTSKIKIVVQYDSPTQDIEWLDTIDMNDYKIRNVFCRFSEKGKDILYKCVYFAGTRMSGEMSKIAPDVFKFQI